MKVLSLYESEAEKNIENSSMVDEHLSSCYDCDSDSDHTCDDPGPCF